MISFIEPDSLCSCASDANLSSRQWLEKFGLKAQKLRLYDALASCAFHHSDGVVDIKSMPADEGLQTDAVSFAIWTADFLLGWLERAKSKVISDNDSLYLMVAFRSSQSCCCFL